MDDCKKATLLLEAIGGLSSICDLSLHIFCQHWSRESYSNVRWMSKLTSVTLLRMSDLLVDAVPPVACIKWLSHLELSTVGGAHKDAFQFIAGLTLLTELSLSMEFGPVKLSGLSTLQGLNTLKLSGPPLKSANLEQRVPWANLGFVFTLRNLSS